MLLVEVQVKHCSRTVLLAFGDLQVVVVAGLLRWPREGELRSRARWLKLLLTLSERVRLLTGSRVMCSSQHAFDTG